MTTATHLSTSAPMGPTTAQYAEQCDSTHLDSAVHDLSRPSSSDAVPSLSPPPRRSSVFFEEGLKGEDAIVDAQFRRTTRPSLRVRFRSKVDIHEAAEIDEPLLVQQPDQLPPLFPTAPRIMFFVLLLAVLIPSLGNSPFLKAGITPIGAKAGPVKVPVGEPMRSLPTLEKRQDSDTDICKRWSGQSAVVNGTMYYYGGRKSTSADQTSDTWSTLPAPSY